MGKLTDSIKERILKLHEEGVSNKEIAKITHLHESTVSRIISSERKTEENLDIEIDFKNMEIRDVLDNFKKRYGREIAEEDIIEDQLKI